MISPRATRLVRVPDARAMQRVLIELSRQPDSCQAAVILPTRGATAEFRRTIQNVVGGAVPDLVTRDDFYARLAEQLPAAPPLVPGLVLGLLSGFEREVLFRLAAGDAERAGARAPFKLRPGLIVEILRFYDELRRNHRTVDDFHRLIGEELEAVADTDRGAERLLQQTEFLAAAFAAFERRVAATGRVDEHGLRALLLVTPAAARYEHVIVAVADQAADRHGLWTTDFDVLARLPGVRRLDIVATERLLASGFHQRLHERHLPGIEDVRIGDASAAPVLLTPPSPPDKKVNHVYTSRDREEELVRVARWLAASEDDGQARLAVRNAVVFQRPLPYLYLARQVFGSAHIPYHAMDALPLAGEPFVAGFDVVLAFVAAEGTRATTIELLGSPQWSFSNPVDGHPIERAEVAALDELFRDLKFLGGWDRLRAVGLEFAGARPALAAAVAAAEELMPAATGAHASIQIDTMLQFIARHERLPEPSDPWYSSHVRARAAVLAGLAGLRDAHARYDDEPVKFVELAAALRRWIEGHTFAPETGTGLRLIDATAAAFADVDTLHVVGLVDGDWPERSSKSILFPSKLLEPLGWPAQSDRLAAARARFHDLLQLPSSAVALSTFLLEDDAIVAASAFADEVSAAGLRVRVEAVETSARVFDHEALAIDPGPLDRGTAPGDAALWLAFRQQLPPLNDARFHGEVGPRAPGTYAVSRLERYLECPFKYFAANVLRLEEERDHESGLTPQERGQLLHAVFEAFFQRWRSAGKGAITSDLLEDALELFERTAEIHLDRLSPIDRAHERIYLLGSAVAPGLAERAFAFEIEHGVGIVERLLEHILEGTFVFRGADGPREVSLKVKADRIDLLDDGTLRVVDYKTGRAPKPSRSLQLPVYSLCAQQQLAGRRGRDWTVSRAGYVAFREKNAFVSVGTNLEKALAEGERRVVDAITAIEEGRFPPAPEEPWLCSRCGYPHLCRKDYVGDE